MFTRTLQRTITLILAIALTVLIATGCQPAQTTADEAENLTIVTSFLPMYIFTLNLIDGIENITIENLASPDVGCLHDYQLLPGDMVKLERADIFIYNGAGMESFLEDLAGRSSLVKIEASEGISLLDLHDDDEDHDEDEDHDHDDNAHVWLSIRLAIRQVKNISLGLQTADPENAARYQANEAAYVARLELLHQRFDEELADVAVREIITFHDAFPYLAAEYGLEVVAVIQRDPGSEPSAAELAKTVDIIRQKGVGVLFVEPQYSSRVAETIAAETGAAIFTLDPVVTGDASALTYEQIMADNLDILLEALNP